MSSRFPERAALMKTTSAMLSSQTLTLAIRAAQGLFAIIVLGLTASVASWYNIDTLTSSPSQINWLLTVSLFTIVSLAYIEGVRRFSPKFFHPYAHLALELANALFYLAGFIALGVFISSLLFCRGAVCSSAQAAVAFGAFEWMLWTATAVLTTMDLFKTGRLALRLPGKGRGRGGQAPLGGPPMKEAPEP